MSLNILMFLRIICGETHIGKGFLKTIVRDSSLHVIFMHCSAISASLTFILPYY
jgi:hypothetical protein